MVGKAQKSQNCIVFQGRYLEEEIITAPPENSDSE
jgi:hypothetical protein